MRGIVSPTSGGVLPVMDTVDGPRRDGAVGRPRRCRSARRSRTTTPEGASATVAALSAVCLAPAPALAYHDTIDNGGGGLPLDVILLFAGAVAFGMIALAYFGRKTRKTRSKSGRRKQRAKSLDRKRR